MKSRNRIKSFKQPLFPSRKTVTRNISLTPAQDMLIDEIAAHLGFTTVSAYVQAYVRRDSSLLHPAGIGPASNT